MRPLTRSKALAPMGEYELLAIHFPSQKESLGGVICRSGRSPITMDISYTPENGAFYLVSWPTDFSKEIAVEGIRGIGRQVNEPVYRCLPPGSPPVLTYPYLPEKESLDDALFDGFGQLAVVTPDIAVAYTDDYSVSPHKGGGFGLRTLEGDPVTEPFIREIVERTIAIEHAGGVAVALETLGAVFDRYKDQDVALLVE